MAVTTPDRHVASDSYDVLFELHRMIVSFAIILHRYIFYVFVHVTPQKKCSSIFFKSTWNHLHLFKLKFFISSLMLFCVQIVRCWTISFLNPFRDEDTKEISTQAEKLYRCRYCKWVLTLNVIFSPHTIEWYSSYLVL